MNCCSIQMEKGIEQPLTEGYIPVRVRPVKKEVINV